jgi:predicted glutamine amidotransferase
MCRLYGQVSLRAESAADGLAENAHSLLNLAQADPKRLQPDGWGVGWYTRSGPKIVKSHKPIYREAKRLRSTSTRAKSRVVFGHIRHMSNPRGLPRHRMLSTANSQPYAYKNLLFVHNGEVTIPDEVARFLGAYRKKIKGLNDSEVFFWQFVKFYDAYQDIPRALEACVRETIGIWQGCKSRHRRKKTSYLGFNTLVSNGSELHAMCHFPALAKAKGLLSKKQIWGRMSFSLEGSRARVASEDLKGGRWKRLGSAELLSIRPQGGRLRAERRRFTPGG